MEESTEVKDELLSFTVGHEVTPCVDTKRRCSGDENRGKESKEKSYLFAPRL